MSIPFLILLLGVCQGLLHAVGPDHCAVMATLSTQSVSKAFQMAWRFAVGHALALGSLAALCWGLGVGLSENFEKWAEILGGGVLVALAFTVLFFPSTLSHGHPHFGAHGPRHEHPKVPLAAGALMALSGVRSLLLALPPLMVGGSGSLHAWVYLPGFGLGILLGMSAMGLLMSFAVQRINEAIFLWVQKTVAVATGGLGVFWILVRW